ncbi:hypothetical protein CFN16_27105 [Pseudomonas fluorescens]|uniref:TnsE C-terminal domain-containing protein n=1 Tax=Pseudomonas fluorescens TaxID=294 RepID=A0A345V4L9_PSEFL|nr:hypothetical protein CFN16_27105 [Pseudomonas fluorescens]
MLTRIKREKVFPPSARANLYEYDPNLPMGSWVVWWYGRLIKNFADNTVPLVMVTLQRLDGDSLTEEFYPCKIAISRLRFYPQGLILEDRLPVAKIALETLWFKVGFGYKDWNFRTAKELRRCSAKHDLSLPDECANDWSLEFKQPEGALTLNCVDYLVRGYSIRSEIPRILTTYEWNEVRRRLLKHETPKHEKNLSDRLVVYPHPDMVEEDEVFLALLANEDRRTRRAAESIFSQNDTPSFKAGNPHTLQVLPWFDGPTELKCRGLWINGGNDFVCMELRGYIGPAGKRIDNRGYRPSKKTKHVEDRRGGPPIRRFLTDADLDIGMTDTYQPRSPYPREDVIHDDFQIVSTREKTRTLLDSPDEETQARSVDESPPSKYSTGDSLGEKDDDTGKFTMTAEPVDADYNGALAEMWKSFTRLHAAGQIDEVRWYLNKKFYEKGPPRLFELSDRQYTEKDDPERKLEKWLNLHSRRRRGVMFIVIKVNSKYYLVVETERRHWVNKDGEQQEESSRGLICAVSGAREIKSVCEFIDAELPQHAGVFKNLAWTLDNRFALYSHRPSEDKSTWLDGAAINALRQIGVTLRKPVKHTPATEANKSDVSETDRDQLANAALS